MKFFGTLILGGKTATGIEVPPEVVAAAEAAAAEAAGAAAPQAAGGPGGGLPNWRAMGSGPVFAARLPLLLPNLNARAKINVPFGASLTKVAALPPGAQPEWRTLVDILASMGRAHGGMR